MNIILTNKGLEDISAEELKNFETKTVKTGNGRVLFESTDEELKNIIYESRTITHCGVILKTGTFKDEEDLLKSLDLKIDIEEDFGLITEREGNHNFTSFDITNSISQQIIKKTGKAVNYKKPKTQLFLIIDKNTFYFFEDYARIDLGRRNYRVFLTRNSLRGNVAAAMLQIAGYKSEKVLLDPFCKDGIIPIEAALISENKSVNKHIKNELPSLQKYSEETETHAEIYCTDDQFAHVNYAKKNAKIAGVNKKLHFSRTDIEWLPMKVEKADLIVTYLPRVTNTNEKKMRKKISDFENSVKEIMKKGRIVICTNEEKEVLKRNALEKIEFYQGKEKLYIQVYS